MLGRFHVNWTIFSEFSSCLNLPVRVCIWVKHPSYDKVSCSQWLAHAIEATIAPGAPVFDTLNLNHKRYRSKGRRLHLFLHSCTVNSITLNIPKHPSYSNLNIPKPDLNHHALWPILFFLAMWAVTALGPCSELRCTAQGNAQRWPRLYQDVLPGSFWCPFFRVFVATNQLDQVPQKPPKFVIQKAPGKCPFPSLTFTFRDQKDQISGGIFGCSPRTQKIKHRKLRGQKSLQRSPGRSTWPRSKLGSGAEKTEAARWRIDWNKVASNPHQDAMGLPVCPKKMRQLHHLFFVRKELSVTFFKWTYMYIYIVSSLLGCCLTTLSLKIQVKSLYSNLTTLWFVTFKSPLHHFANRQINRRLAPTGDRMHFCPPILVLWKRS